MAWNPSNAEQVIPREHIFGTIRGVDFGPKVFVIARAAAPMLLWLGGHSWSLNGHQRYSESNLTLIRDRIKMDGWRNYTSLEPHGGRLTVNRIAMVKDQICEVFGEDRWAGIVHATKTAQTLLIEGGGKTPQPSAKMGHDAYVRWRNQIIIHSPS